MDAAFFFINLQYLVVGFLGGLIHAFRVKKASPWEVIGYIMAGGMAANFFVPPLLKLMTVIPPWMSNFDGLLAFGIGMSGRKLCNYAEKWFGSLTFLGKTRND